MREITRLSASQCNSFRMCSLKWHFRYVERAPEESRSGPLVVGSVVDTAIKSGLHMVKNGEVRLEELNPDILFQEAWEAELASTGDLPVLWGSKGMKAVQATAQSLVRSYLSREDIQDLANRLDLDIRFDLPLVDEDLGVNVPNVTLVGILDAVEHLPDGRLRPLDWKTAASRAGYDQDTLAIHLQGSLYAWGLRQLHGDTASPSMAFHVGLKLKDPIWQEYEVDLGRDAQARALRTVEAVYQAMQSGWAFPEPSFLCGGCSYRERCRSWAGSPRTVIKDVFAESIEHEHDDPHPVRR